jgi:hypothetical protein
MFVNNSGCSNNIRKGFAEKSLIDSGRGGGEKGLEKAHMTLLETRSVLMSLRDPVIHAHGIIEGIDHSAFVDGRSIGESYSADDRDVLDERSPSAVSAAIPIPTQSLTPGQIQADQLMERERIEQNYRNAQAFCEDMRLYRLIADYRRRHELPINILPPDPQEY